MHCRLAIEARRRSSSLPPAALRLITSRKIRLNQVIILAKEKSEAIIFFAKDDLVYSLRERDPAYMEHSGQKHPVNKLKRCLPS